MSIKISVVIPTYNRADKLKEVLPTLLRQTFPQEDYEILLCDSGSTDGTEELVKGLNAPNLRFLPGPNLGRSGARNRGIDEAKGEIILFTDADILADPQLLELHWQKHSENRDCAAVGNEIQVKTLEEYYEFSQEPEHHSRHNPERKFLPWHHFLTGNASVPKAILQKVGGFDLAFQGYGHEDLELGYRLIKAGLKIHYLPKAINYHWHPVGYEEQKGRMRLAGHSTIRFYRKYHDLRISLQMGMNPLSMLVHSFLKSSPYILRLLDRLGERYKLAREIIYQYHYVTGMKEAMGTL
ncbi:glycosyltransferase [bacterium]|nr:glycosyltransferase [bacterium]